MEGCPRTALAVFKGHPRHLQAHLRRLQRAAEALQQPGAWLEPLASEIGAQILIWMDRPDAAQASALRLALHPGLGLLRVRLEPLPASPQPYLLAPMPHPMAHRKNDPLLRHKGLGGSWGPAILAEARSLGAADALLVWTDGSLAETAIAAVGVEREGSLTIPLPEGRVASLAEQLDLPAWATQRGLRIEQGSLGLAQARQGQLWCLNALRGIWPAQLL